MDRLKYCIATALALLWVQSTYAEQKGLSKYSGQEKRAIKSLSSEDIDELKSGGGWGFAKVAELNGLPGPIHLLELKDEIELTDYQTQAIQNLYDEMKTQAIEHGKMFIELEQKLEELFQSSSPNANELEALLVKIENTRKKLRFTHLAAHLKTPRILTSMQIESYNNLRGYSSNNLCDNIPKGHNAAMSRKHNQCD